MSDELFELKKRRKKRVNVGQFDYNQLDGDLDDIIDMLSSYKKSDDDSIYFETDASFYEDDGYCVINVYNYRDETDQEIEERVDKYNKEQLNKYLREQENIKKEKETYLMLKEKYGKEL